MNKKLILIILVVFVFYLVDAAQPALPTSIYGKVLDDNEEPAEGIEVIVQWVDSDDISRTASTKTLSKDYSQTIGIDLKGSYLFNSGFIKAKQNSKISIKINNVKFEEVASNPGGIVKIKDAVLTYKSDLHDNYAGSGTEPTEGVPGSGSGFGKPTQGRHCLGSTQWILLKAKPKTKE